MPIPYISACDYAWSMSYDSADNGTALSQSLSGIEQDGVVFPTVTNPYLSDEAAINAFISVLSGGGQITYTYDAVAKLCTLQSYVLHFPLTQMFLIQDITGTPMPYQLPIEESNCTIIPNVAETPGCTVSTAINYNSEATYDDGTCYYNSATYSDDQAEEIEILKCRTSAMAGCILEELRKGCLTSEEYQCKMLKLWYFQTGLNKVASHVYTGTVIIAAVEETAGHEACTEIDFSGILLNAYFVITLQAGEGLIASISGYYFNINQIPGLLEAAVGSGGDYVATSLGSGVLEVCADESFGASANGQPVIATLIRTGFDVERNVPTVDTAVASFGIYSGDFETIFWPGSSSKGIFIDTNGVTSTTFSAHFQVAQFVPQSVAFSAFTQMFYMYQTPGASGLNYRLYAYDPAGTEIRLVWDSGVPLGTLDVSQMAVGKRTGYLAIPFTTLDTVRVFDCTGGVIPEPQLGYSPIALSTGVGPTMILENPELTAVLYGFFYVLCRTSSTVEVIEPLVGTQVTSLALGFVPNHMTWVSDSNGIGAGNYHLWTCGNSGNIKVYDQSLTLVQTIAVSGAAQITEMCQYGDGPVFCVTDIGLAIINTDFSVLIPGTTAYGTFTNMVWNPTEERIYAAVNTGGVDVLELVEDTTVLTELLSGGVDPIPFSREAVLQNEGNNCLSDDQADIMFQNLKEAISAGC